MYNDQLLVVIIIIVEHHVQIKLWCIYMRVEERERVCVRERRRLCINSDSDQSVWREMDGWRESECESTSGKCSVRR